jgi:hypothetical protein
MQPTSHPTSDQQAARRLHPDFRPVNPLGLTAAAAIVALAFLMAVFQVAWVWDDYAQVQQMVAGRMTYDQAWDARFERLMTEGAISSAVLLGLLGAGVVHLAWFWRARQNAERFSPVRHRLSQGWAIGCWFVPVVNCVLPPVAMNDLARASAPDGDRRGVDPLVALWWAALLLGSLLATTRIFSGRTVSVLTYAADDPRRVLDGGREALSAFHTAALVTTAAHALALTGAVLVAVLITRISFQQTERFGGAPGANPADPTGPVPVAPVDLAPALTGPAPAAPTGAAPEATAAPVPAPGDRRAPSELRPAWGLGIAAVLLAWLTLIGPLIMLTAAVAYSRGEAAAELASSMLLGIQITLFGTVATGALLMTWLARARAVADRLCSAPHRFARSWTVVGWLVPLVNLVVPVLVVQDVLRASRPTTPSAAPTLSGAPSSFALPLWWAGWVGGWVALAVAFAVSVPDTRAAWAGFGHYAAIALGLLAIAAGGLTVIVGQVDRWQTDRLTGRAG